MEITGIDHLYVETAHWEHSERFWTNLGFTWEDRWGSDGHRAGRLTSGDATIVLAESGDPAPLTPFFAITGADDATDLPGLVSPLEPTHWGTRWIRIADPDGRVHALEETS
jgi:hypothetical protein